MYVCICNAVTDRDIRRAAANGADNLYALRDRLGVASCCGSCAAHAVEILDDCQQRRPQAEPAMYVPAPA
jgi:bacterioferritin-associated ferredoxin